MATSPGPGAPSGTQTVPGQTPQSEPPALAGAVYAEHLQRLLDRFPEATVPAWRYADGMPTASVPSERLVEACTWLRDEATPRFDLLIDVCGAHWPIREHPFEVTYIFHSLATNLRLRLKCSVGGETPTLPTICEVYLAANWPEREIWDLFGVVFSGHPDLRRIVTPNDWEGHPLRKDFPLGEEPVEFYRSPVVPSGVTPPAVAPSASDS
ncbi:MAG: NADH-quinone oxidoreductase subunit C [Chloroflexota bacterium]|nr:NADH-quinone oxidoreductase subunit C [Chloroflexota bacterium]